MASSINEEDLCIICYSNKNNVTLRPCKHQCCKWVHVNILVNLIVIIVHNNFKSPKNCTQYSLKLTYNSYFNKL